MEAIKMKHPALRYHGAKFRLAPWIISHFPEHKYYVEPFGGAAGVLLNKPKCHAEVYNDLDGDIVNFFEVLRNPYLREQLIEQLVLTPYSRQEFELAYEFTTNQVERARRTAIRASMGFGSAGATLGKTGFRSDIKRKYNTVVDVWNRYPQTIIDVGERFSNVQIENKPALDVIKKHDGIEVLQYIDPPYVLSTRSMGGRNKTYRNELSDSDHENLITTISNCNSMFVLSGYDSEIYNDLLKGWRKEVKNSGISSGKGTVTKTECLWLSPSVTKLSKVA
jgi:DNA adenine methylase